jgi:hypothetical protein
MLWEMLVTDGHVRAARLRRLQPWLIAIGIVLIWLGYMVVRAGPDLAPGVPAGAKLQERLMHLQQHAQSTFQKLPRLDIARDAQNSLPPAREIAELTAAITKSLNDTGDLPEDDLKLVEVDDEESFWKGEWGIEQLHYWRDGDNVLVAGNVSVGSPQYPQPARWAGLFHRGETEKGEMTWVYGSLAAGNLFAPGELPYMAPQQVALSLEPFLPEMPEVEPPQREE